MSVNVCKAFVTLWVPNHGDPALQSGGMSLLVKLAHIKCYIIITNVTLRIPFLGGKRRAHTY